MIDQHQFLKFLMKDPDIKDMFNRDLGFQVELGYLMSEFQANVTRCRERAVAHHQEYLAYLQNVANQTKGMQ